MDIASHGAFRIGVFMKAEQSGIVRAFDSSVNIIQRDLACGLGKVCAAAALTGFYDTCVTELSEDDFNDYRVRLAQAGFSPVEHVSEEIKEQGYVSIGTLLSNGEKALSISYVPDTLTIYISLEK